MAWRPPKNPLRIITIARILALQRKTPLSHGDMGSNTWVPTRRAVSCTCPINCCPPDSPAACREDYYPPPDPPN
eukprot:12154416-Alexandrium_andersonii.AAC.1